MKSVFEKGEALLDIVHDATISDNMKKMQSDYQDLCLAAKVQYDQLSYVRFCFRKPLNPQILLRVDKQISQYFSSTVSCI